MIIKDIIEGYFTLRYLKKHGYVEKDGLSLYEFTKLVVGAERNIKNKEVEKNENKQS